MNGVFSTSGALGSPSKRMTLRVAATFFGIALAQSPAGAIENHTSSSPPSQTVNSTVDFSGPMVNVSVAAASPVQTQDQIDPSLNGWDFIYGEMHKAGIRESLLKEIFSDPRMPERELITFSLKPKEPKNVYDRINMKRSLASALKCYADHEAAFRKAQALYNVPAHVILAIVQIETSCGRNTGKQRVFPRLVRLAAAAAPDTVAKNYSQKVAQDPSVQYADVAARAEWLKDKFLPSALATFVIADQFGLHPLDVLGSDAGAIGVPQFLPANSVDYGVDADGDGVINMFEHTDAIVSAAGFLNHHGWTKTKLPLSVQREIIWNYNRSEPYIDSVIQLANLIEKDLPRPTKSNIATEISGRFTPLAAFAPLDLFSQ